MYFLGAIWYKQNLWICHSKLLNSAFVVGTLLSWNLCIFYYTFSKPLSLMNYKYTVPHDTVENKYLLQGSATHTPVYCVYCTVVLIIGHRWDFTSTRVKYCKRVAYWKLLNTLLCTDAVLYDMKLPYRVLDLSIDW